MDTLALLIGVLLCLAMVNGRSFDNRHDADPVSEAEEEGLNKHGSDMRHQRRRRWQMNYGFEYPATPPVYYQDRRDYDRYQQDLLPRIVKLLEEISVFVRRPQVPVPPQQIYIPYPVPYPVPHYLPCIPSNGNNPNVTSRFPEMEDSNQNWGFVMNEEENKQIGDGTRPISFDPIKPIRPLKRPAPNVEHGTLQSDSTHTTQAPTFSDNASPAAVGRTPIACSAAILACCADKQRQNCFNTFGCGNAYNGGKACEAESVDEALEVLRSSYSPMP